MCDSPSGVIQNYPAQCLATLGPSMRMLQAKRRLRYILRTLDNRILSILRISSSTPMHTNDISAHLSGHPKYQAREQGGKDSLELLREDTYVYYSGWDVPDGYKLEAKW